MPFRIEVPDYDLQEKLQKYENTAILVIGPQEWYDNLSEKYAEYGKTWLQNSKKINSLVVDYFNKKIASKQFFNAYGYVTQPESRVCYKFKIDQVISQGSKIPPPDETAPPFSEYDITKGKCNSGNFEYYTWFHIIDMCNIGPYEMTDFININKNAPIRSCSGQALYYIHVPDKILYSLNK